MKTRTHLPEPKEEGRLVPLVAYSVEEAAESLNIGRTYAYQLIKEGKLRAVKVGRRTLIPVPEVEAFMVRLAAGSAQ